MENGNDWALWVAIAAAIGAVFGAIFPWWNGRNESLLRQAVLSLERAYSALTVNGQYRLKPPADRLNWLAAARHIQRYRAIKRRIWRPSIHRLLCDDHEEYWRHQFYLLLKAVATELDYFGEPGSPEAIHPSSAIIIHHFSEWSEDADDPIDGVDMESLLAQKPIILQRSIPLRCYLERYPVTSPQAERASKSG